MVARTTKMIRSNDPVQYGLPRSSTTVTGKSRPDTRPTWMHKPNIKHKPNNFHLDSNSVSYIILRNSVVLIIHFTNKTCTYICSTSWKQHVQSSPSPLSTHDHLSHTGQPWSLYHASLWSDHHDLTRQNPIAQLHVTPCFEVTASVKSWDTRPYLTRSINYAIDLQLVRGLLDHPFWSVQTFSKQ